MSEPETTVKIPAGIGKWLMGLLGVAGLGTGGGTVWTSIERVMKLEARVEALEKRADDHHDWLLKYADDIRKLEAKP